MQKALGKIVLSTIFCTACMTGSAFAVEYAGESAATPQTAEAPAPSTQAPAVAPAGPAADPNIQAIVQSPPPAKPVQSANNAASQFINQARAQGMPDDVFIGKGIASLSCPNPADDNNFMLKRSMKVMEASLQARVNIISSIRSTMSAADLVTTPGTDLNAKFYGQQKELEQKLSAQYAEAQKLLTAAERVEIESYEGTTTLDRFNGLLEAAINKLDGNFDSGQIASDKQARYAALKKEYSTAHEEQKRLEKEIQALSDTEQATNASTIGSMASMSLMGSIPVAQFESWDPTTQIFETAVIVMWSKSNQEAVAAFLQGVPCKAAPKAMSLYDWLSNTDWSSATGGRKFQDNEGNVHFIGIAAYELGSTGSSRTKAQRSAALMAKKEVVAALYADVMSAESYQAILKTFESENGENSQAYDSLAVTMSSSFENRSVSGLHEVYAQDLVYPLTGKQVHVCIYDLSSNSARLAYEAEYGNHQTHMLDISHQQQQKAVEAYYKSEQEGANAQAAQTGISTAPTQAPVQAPLPSAGQSSGASTGGQGSDSFSW